MSNLDKALSDYTTTICNLLDAEFLKSNPPTIYVGEPINIDANGNSGTQTSIDFPPARTDRTDEFDHGQDSGSQRTPSPTIRTGRPKPKPKPKTTNPLKVMGKLTVLATLVYAVFTFFF